MNSVQVRASPRSLYFVFCLLSLMGTIAMQFDGVPTYELNDGARMPKAGIGVYRCDDGPETYNTVRWALELGVRLVDTAAMYENEESVGMALHDFEARNEEVLRENVFVTTKLDTGDHGFQAAYEACQYALEETLQTEYIDLFLIHSPFGGRIVETWDALVQLQADGLVKSIGVSNFGISHLEALRQHGRPMPAVNQIEMHPLVYKKRKDLIDYCKEHNIRITAYGSLFSGWTELYQAPALLEIAQFYNKTVPQILLRWAIHHGFAIIPKSSSSKMRQAENFDIFDFSLTDSQLEVLDTLSMETDFDEYWDPIDEAEVEIGDLHAARREMRRVVDAGVDAQEDEVDYDEDTDDEIEEDDEGQDDSVEEGDDEDL